MGLPGPTIVPGLHNLADERTSPFLNFLTPNEFKAQILSRQLLNGPLVVIFKRHSRSAGNVRESIEGLGEEFADLKQRFLDYPDYDLPLVGIGKRQSIAAGRCIAFLCHHHFIPAIDRGIISPFTRPKESFIGVVQGIREYCRDHGIAFESVFEPNAIMEISPVVGERFWHNFNHLPSDVRDREYEARENEPFFWTPGSAGERMQQVYERARSFFSKLHRASYAGKVVFVESHGELINGAELAMHELDPFGDQFKNSFRIGIPNAGLYIFSRAPFSEQMDPALLGDLSGFDYYLKTVPYELRGAQAEKFHEWTGELAWKKRTSTRMKVASFPEEALLSERSRVLAQELEAAGIGKGKVRDRF